MQRVDFSTSWVTNGVSTKHYDADMPIEQVMLNAPETIEETKWNALVLHWYTEEAKVILS